MQDLGPGIAMSVFVIAFAAVFILRGPLGKALAERLSGRTQASDQELQRLRAELEQVRHELAELHERLDFAQRLLARSKEAGLVGPGAGE